MKLLHEQARRFVEHGPKAVDHGKRAADVETAGQPQEVIPRFGVPETRFTCRQDDQFRPQGLFKQTRRGQPTARLAVGQDDRRLQRIGGVEGTVGGDMENVDPGSHVLAQPALGRIGADEGAGVIDPANGCRLLPGAGKLSVFVA